jgi:hypothetical protein
MFFEGCEGNAAGKPRVALTGRNWETSGGWREREVETSEARPAPGARAWESARGGSRRGGDRTTRTERDGSGGTDPPKGATPGVDARRWSRSGTQRTSRPLRRRSGTNRRRPGSSRTRFARGACDPRRGSWSNHRSSRSVAARQRAAAPRLVYPVTRREPSLRPVVWQVRIFGSIPVRGLRRERSRRRGRFRHLARDRAP